MGYSYGRSDSGRMVLSCDGCGGLGGVRKRTCPHKVLGSSPTGNRVALPWCPPPALCSACLKTHGGTKGIHAQCAESAAKAQATYDAEQARFDAGERKVTAAWGDWADWVPDGMVGITFGGDARFLIPAADYEGHHGGWESDFLTIAPVLAVIG